MTKKPIKRAAAVLFTDRSLGLCETDEEVRRMALEMAAMQEISLDADAPLSITEVTDPAVFYARVLDEAGRLRLQLEACQEKNAELEQENAELRFENGNMRRSLDQLHGA